MKTETIVVQRREKKEVPWDLSCARILPDRRPRFVVQILHGFSGRKEYWYPFMEFAALCGGVAVIHDLRGHGMSTPAADVGPEEAVASFGYDYETLLDDIDAVYEACGDPFAPLPAEGEGFGGTDPDKERLIPRFLLGQGMGALMAAQYAARRGTGRRRGLDGLILSGLPRREKFASLRLAALGVRSLFTGDSACPKGVNRRAFRRYDRKFAPEPGWEGGLLWLTEDPSVRAAIADDPLCNKPHPLGDYRNLCRLRRDVYRPSDWGRPADIPVLLMAGEHDPVAGGDAQILWAERFLRDMGFRRVEARMYRNMRHEIFLDEGKQAPFSDAVRFTLTYLPGKRVEQP